jgi:electron transfer flavoprotein alpha subunit
MKILVIAEHDQQALKQATYHTVTAALQIDALIDVLIIGHQCSALGETVANWQGVQRVLIADAPAYEHQLAENTGALIAEIGKNYTHILAPATTFGKNILPRAAALLDTAMIADIVKVISPTTFVRPIYAGNALTTIVTECAITLLTVRSTAFSSTLASATTPAVIEKVTTVIPNTLSAFSSHELQVSSRPDLTAARVIISGGRGLKSAENFKLLEALADKLGAAIGASRAAVDAGFAPNDYQVGQTGKVVAPDLYIAIGISGAIQHLAGMKESKVIVAINNDPDAPIFQIADYGLVGDLFTILPALMAELNK